MKTKKRRLKRFALVTVLVLVCSYIILSPAVLPSVYETHFFRPDYCREPSARLKECFLKRGIADVRKTELFIDTGQGQLHAFWFNHQHAARNRTILIHLGAAGNIAARADLIALLLEAGKEKGYSVFIYEHRGFGESEGSASLLGVTEDGLTAYDFLQEKGHSPADILLYGESLGGAIATYVSTQRDVSGIITQGTFASLSQIAWDRGTEELGLPTFLLQWACFGETFFPARMDNIKVVSSSGFEVPLLVVHGAQDNIVPVRHAHRLFGAARCRHKQKLILPQSGHCLLAAPNDERKFVETVAAFLSKLKGSPEQIAKSQ